ncbi:ABC transporter ATP-binding protein [Paenibacillus sedimenti]|uniref:ABC transporter ATP-binding protein n=1 Tax=Paenibacillus sedimenti TaxID=2770274 RepID=A0A926KP07_9BACL|nr:ABC transporter ATP-binding protein [Paenibacillus sedimenti]MBD0379733.1 ABC transporter ATP-binding protein [Paenibacillus sedimenti]
MAQILIFVKKLHEFAGFKLHINLAGMIVISLLEGAGIFLLAPMLSMIGLFDSNSEVIPIVSWIVEPLNGWPDGIKLSVILGIFISLLVFQALLQRYQTNLNEGIEQGFIRHLRLGIYEALLQSDWSFFLKKRKSDLIHIMTSELPRVSYGIYQSLRLMTTFLFTFVQIGFALWLSAPLTASVLICGLALAVYSRKFIRKSKTIGDQTTSLSQSYIAGMTDHFNGIKDIKSNMMERQHMTWFRSLCYRMEHNFVQFTRLQSVSQYNYKVASGLLVALFVFLSFIVFHVQAEKLVIIIIIFSRLWPKFSMLQSGWEQIATTIPAFKSLLDLEKEYAAAKEMNLQDIYNIENPLRINQGIECRNVYYRYETNHSAYALQDINLHIPANRMTAIVGKSGAGKSTLIDLLIGLVKPEKGEVFVDGNPLTIASMFSLRRAISYVSQDPFLFHASLRENLQIAAPHASEKQMWEALRFTASDDFVKKLPQGLDTDMGDRGLRLSGGERQRIVLARAILRKPSILVLDEATSALDSENEAKIQEALELLKGTMTIIVIAHRLSTIRNADQVVVLNGGRVIQQGGYQQLSLERDGMFGQLLDYQARAKR